MTSLSEIQLAIYDDNLDELKRVWDADVANSTYIKRYVGGTREIHVLVFAIHIGNECAVEYMLENGADPNCREKYTETTPIIDIMWRDDIAEREFIVKALMKNGANPYLQNEHNDDAFAWQDGEWDPLLESYLMVELVAGEADNLPLDVWRVVKSFIL